MTGGGRREPGSPGWHEIVPASLPVPPICAHVRARARAILSLSSRAERPQAATSRDPPNEAGALGARAPCTGGGGSKFRAEIAEIAGEGEQAGSRILRPAFSAIPARGSLRRSRAGRARAGAGAGAGAHVRARAGAILSLSSRAERPQAATSRDLPNEAGALGTRTPCTGGGGSMFRAEIAEIAGEGEQAGSRILCPAFSAIPARDSLRRSRAGRARARAGAHVRARAGAILSLSSRAERGRAPRSRGIPRTKPAPPGPGHPARAGEIPPLALPTLSVGMTGGIGEPARSG